MISTGQTKVSPTAATLIVPSLAGPATISITSGTARIYLGPGTALSSTNGYMLAASAAPYTLTLPTGWQATIYGLSDSGTQTTSWLISQPG